MLYVKLNKCDQGRKICYFSLSRDLSRDLYCTQWCTATSPISLFLKIYTILARKEART